MTTIEQSAAGVLTTALEGGIGYWSVASEIVRDDDLNVLSVKLEDGELIEDEAAFPPIVVNVESVVKALRKIAHPAMLEALGHIDEADRCRHAAVQSGPLGGYQPMKSVELKCAQLLLGDEDVLGDIDAADADEIVQVAMFGGVVYGRMIDYKPPETPSDLAGPAEVTFADGKLYWGYVQIVPACDVMHWREPHGPSYTIPMRQVASIRWLDFVYEPKVAPATGTTAGKPEDGNCGATTEPLERLGLWLATNAGLSDEPTHDEVDATIDKLGATIIGVAIEDLFEVER